MQQILTRPWVDIGNWSAGGGDPWEPQEAEKLAEKSKVLKDTLSINMNFEVFNRSVSPLRVEQITVVAGIPKNGDWHWKTFEDRSGRILRPQAPNCENSEAFTVSFDLESSEILRYAQDGLYTRLHVKIFYLDWARETIRQDFPMEAVLKPGTPALFTKQRSQRIKEIDRQTSTP